jgi:hypothetical protein
VADLDNFLPEADETVAEHVVVAADATRTYAAIGSADVSGDRVLGLGGLPARIAGLEPAPRTLDAVLAADIGPLELDAEPGVRRVIGVAGRYSAFERHVERLKPGGFVAFEEPGCLKAVVIFSLQPQADGRTLLGCEVRLRATDEDTRSTLRTMWFAAGAGLRLLVRRALDRIKATAESS